jgi:hypothetical protein
MKSMDEYREMLSDRPVKWSPKDVDYRDCDAVGIRCLRCIHYYERSIDRFGVCEIMRPESDESVNPDYVCDFFTADGQGFPYRKAR